MILLFMFLLSIFSTNNSGQLGAFEKTQPAKTGKELYEKNCVKCHGKDGGKRLAGDKNLIISDKTESETIYVITFGKKRMPAWGKKMKESEILLLSEYVVSFRK